MRLFFTGPRIFGIRPGIIVRPDELLRFVGAKGSTRRASGEIKGSFVYVIQGDHLVKIDISTNPTARLAALQRTSPFPLTYAFVAVTSGDGVDIERAAHVALAPHRCDGGWFDVPVQTAIAAVKDAAGQLGQPLQQIEPHMIDQILRVAAAEDNAAAAKPAWPLRVAWRIFQIVGGAVLGLVVIAAIWLTKALVASW